MISVRALDFRPAFGNLEEVDDATHRNLVLELYDREHLSLRRYLVWLGVGVDSAEEILQESFLRLHQHLSAGGDRVNLRAWLFRVAHNIARNSQSSSQASKTSALSDIVASGEPVDFHASAEEGLLSRERQHKLLQTLSQLSSAERNCLILRSQGLKYREIAEALHLSISTVAENVQRGLQKLKESV